MKATAPAWCGRCPMCRGHVSLYNLRDEASGAFLARNTITSFWGTSFVQHLGIGGASYHFEGEEDCYISYANAPRNWKLADGNPPPSRKPFLRPSWEPEARTFRGEIEWEVPFEGETKWKYELTFAEDFCAIVGGQVILSNGQRQPFAPPWEESEGLSYIRWTPPPETIFGGIYVQGSRYFPDSEGVASYHFDSPEDCYISYANAPGTWRLGDGSRPPQKKPFTAARYDAGTRTFRGNIDWEVPFAGATRWEYEMIFSDDLARIAGGAMKAFSGTSSSGTIRFLDAHSLQAHLRLTGAMLYVAKPLVLMQGPELLDKEEAASRETASTADA